MPGGELRASELRSVLAVDPPPPTVSCADVMRDGRRVVRRRRFGVAIVLAAVLSVLTVGTIVLLPAAAVEPAGVSSSPVPPVTSSPPGTTAPPSVAPTPTNGRSIEDKPLFPPMTTKDVERYSVLLAKQQWLPQGYSAVADSGAKPGQFQLVEDFLRLGVRLTDRQGRTGLLVLTVRSPTGHPVYCRDTDGCRAESLRSGKTRYSWVKLTDAITAEREVLVTTQTGLQVGAVVTDNSAWPILSGSEIAELVTNLAN
ncbi:hypothetical protein [Crossiella cryophila]|uniref:Uncharacterized protein n=1 Tax=Crossiella cryophila TaxID=43355 RepID=A0A7W7C533_9PSEU|nr:hypothetical protein [Crossiella cryophila]MBB4674680.1 hypothetical protein [Crossiella cryophila]